MGFVDDDGEFPVAVGVADFVEHKRKFLHGSNDDFFTCFEEFAKLIGPFGHRSNNGGDLCEPLDIVPKLLVENATVGDDDNSIKKR